MKQIVIGLVILYFFYPSIYVLIFLQTHSFFTELPYNDYFEYYGPDFKLHITPSNMTNQNTPDYLDKIKNRLFDNLRMLPHAPGVQMNGQCRLVCFCALTMYGFIYWKFIMVFFLSDD